MTTLRLSTRGNTAIEVATAAAREAGETLRASFRQENQVQFKGRGNIVTDADFRADSAIKSLLRIEYPDDGILSEESEPVHGSSGRTWILDPLDGTNNFSFGVPFFSTVIALTEGSDVQLGIVYDPIRDEMFSACRGEGTFLNGLQVSVGTKTTVRESLVGLDLGYVEANAKSLLGFITGLWPNVHALRLMGSAALGMAYAASGRLDLYFHLLLYPWELACGQLLVTEAGGMATDWEGKPLGIGEGSVIAANEAVHADFLRIVQAR